MKKLIIICFLIAVFSGNSVDAKILRVGYTGPKVTGVDFSDVNAAVNAAAADDTIQLYQNSAVGSAAVTKRLVFVGFGYRLEVNTGLQSVTSAANAVSLYFNPGSENSVVLGVYGNFYIGVNNVILSRSAGFVRLGWNQNIGSVSFANATVVSSIVDIEGTYGSINNAFISNSIISNLNVPNISGLVSNNMIGGGGQFGSCVVKNNIVTHPGLCITAPGAIFNNNLFARNDNCGIPFTGSGNQFGVNMNNVFANWNNGNYGSESNLVLKSGSPAIGFGIDNNANATDAGIYGGEPGLVYKLSGIPAIPAIYQLTSPQLNANTNPYTITVSVRSNN